MKHQLQTIREFVESAHEGEWASYVDRDAALTALSELERLVGEPVAWCELTQSGEIAYFDGKPMVMIGPVGNEHHRHPLCATPPAQQPQAEAVQCGNCNGTGRMVRDPDIGTDQECFVCDGSGQYNEESPQQAEAVPPGYVLVPLEPDEMWAYRVIRHHQPNLDVGCKDWLECLEEMLHWHAAIAAAQGEKP